MDKWITKRDEILSITQAHSTGMSLQKTIDFVTKLSMVAGAGTAWYLFGNKPTPFLNNKLQYLKYTTGPGLRTIAETSVATPNKAIWNFAAGLEERVKIGNIKLLRAFHMRELTSMLVLRSKEISIESLHAQALKPYLERLAERKIAHDELIDGIIYRGGKIFSKSTGEVLVKHAIPFEGTVLEAGEKKLHKTGLNVLAHAIEGLSPERPNIPVGFIGGKSVLKTVGRLVNAGATDLARNYFALLDNPFEVLGEALHAPIFGEKAANLFRRFGLINKFGVGGREFLMNSSALELVGKHLTHGIPRLLLAFGGFKIADEIIDHTLGGGGITGLLARGYQGVSLMGSYVSQATGLTSLAQWQEQNLPGSTSLLGLAAIPASLALTGALASGVTSILEQFGPEATHPIVREGLGYQAEWYQKLLGAIDESDSWLARIGSKLFSETSGRTKVWATVGGLIGAALALPFLPGALGSSKSPDELKKIYSGEELVPIRKGRFWEFGESSFWGGKIDRFAPHWTVRARKKADKKAIYGDDYGHPIRRFFKWLQDPYYLEKEHAQDRPYALWGPSEPPLGPIGVIWTHTIGKVLKPPVIANTELSAASIEEYRQDLMPRAAKYAPEGAPLTTGAADMPVKTPYDQAHGLTSLVDSILEAGGLRGYILSKMRDSITGNNKVGEVNLESSSRMTSENRSFWDKDLGGMGGLSEFYRRLNRRRRYGEDYISAGPRNTMPDWLPDEYLTGDPYVKLKQGELRLPGRGFEELYPELKGVSPEEYPAVYRYKILEDVAPWSPQKFKYEAITERLAAQGKLTERELDIYNEVKREEKEKEDKLAQLNIKPSSGGILGEYWDLLRKGLHANPFEALTPLSPAHKFLPYADVESYYKDVTLDKKIKAWHTPISSFIEPFLAKAADLVLPPGMVATTEDQRDKDQLDSYFLFLQTAKNKLLAAAAKEARQEGEPELSKYYRAGIKRTLLELSPFAPADQIERYMPSRYKTAAPALFSVTDKSEREEVLSRSPDFLKPYLLGQWAKNDLIAQGDIDKLKELEAITPAPAQTMDVAQAIETKQLPDKNFIGWAPGVDLNALKVKAAEDEGINPYEMGLWSEDIRNAQSLATPEQANNSEHPVNLQAVQSQVKQILKKYGIDPSLLTITPTSGGGSFNINITDDPNSDAYKALKQKGLINA